MAQEKGYDRGLISENNRASAGGGRPSAPKSAAKDAVQRARRKKGFFRQKVTAPPSLPTRPKLSEIVEQKNTSNKGNAAENIRAMFKPKDSFLNTVAEFVEETKNTTKAKPEPSPVQSLTIPPPNVTTAKYESVPTGDRYSNKDIGVQVPSKIKTGQTILRPDGVTEVLGPGGVVLEEIGEDGKVIHDPIKDAGFDPKDPPSSLKKLREEFREHVLTGKDESNIPFEASKEVEVELKSQGLGRFIPKKIKKVINPIGETESGGTSGKAKEKIVTNVEAQNKLTPRDFVATIEEVLDSNRVRVSLSYNDGVNIYNHKGDDEVAKKFKNFRVNYIKNNIQRYKTYMVKDNQYYLVINEQLDDSGDERYLKLKQPLNQAGLQDKVYFVEKRLPDYKDVVRLEPFIDKEDNGIFLRIPNMNSVDNPINFQGTNYSSHDNLTSNKDNDKRDIERLLVSQSLLEVQPNIDYQKTTTDLEFENDDTGFGNFVNFSSAERRLKNFRKKLLLIESHSAASASFVLIADSAAQQEKVELQKQRVINSFDPYEHYLYFESSSYVSSSDGQFHDTAWPKENSSSPFTLAHTTGSDASTWYNAMIASSSAYDQRNMNSLRNSLPEHINADPTNNVFLEFMDMVGQQFDEVWTYTKSITDLNKRVEKISEGISKDVAKHYAAALGLDLVTGNDLMILPEYLLGKDADGGDLYETPQEEVTEEIWKRILANLPFFIKAKGTRRALTGLLNCYGIPSSMLRVREYGGPDKGTGVNYEIKRKFTRATDFKASQYIKTKWGTSSNLLPDTLEFRFRSPKSQDQVILQKDGDFAISLEDNGKTDDYGHLRFTISGSDGVVNYITSSEQPFYNDEFWSVMLKRTMSGSGAEFTSENIYTSASYELTTKYYEASREKILYESSEAMIVTASNMNASYTSSGHIYLGGSGSRFGTNMFTGSLMEYRLWSEPLTASVFDNHVRTPKAYNGNTYSSSYDNLLIRYELNDNKNITTFGVTSSAHVTSYEKHSVQVSGFTGNFSRTLVDKEQMRVPDVGPARRNATKIRIEDTTIKQPLVVNERKEKSSDDFAPIDSNRLGIYFSPTDVVNEDIIYSIADFNFDDYIGDPRDEFKKNYPDLRDIRTEYFKRYSNSNNFWDYLRILKYYDSSVFTQVTNLIPARANASLGVLIEPNILERSKQVVGDRPEFDNRYYENAGHFDMGIQVTRIISGSDNNMVEIGGEYNTYDGEINLAFFDTGSSLGFLNNRSIMILDGIDKRGEYGTTYATASVEDGPGTSNKIFTEVLQPNVTASRTAEHNQEKRYFYSSSLSASIGTPVAYSSSFINSDVQSVAYDSSLFRTFYQGVSLTRDNTIDGKEPIEVNQVSPTTIVTQDSDITKLRTE